jgi:hypothetical protein
MKTTKHETVEIKDGVSALQYIVDLHFVSEDGESGYSKTLRVDADSKEAAVTKALLKYSDTKTPFAGALVYSLVLAF